MQVYKIHISSWTASFRYPNMISGYQPTLTVPPLSTICGLISAAKGEYFRFDNEKIGFHFRYQAKAIDLESIYQRKFKSNTQIKSNVIKREFLADNNLFLYTDSEKIANYFDNSQYQLLLGRSGDLAQVNSIEEINATNKIQLKRVHGTLVPMKKHKIASPIQALPIHFSNDIPRKNLGTQPYFIVDCKTQVSLKASGFSDKFYNSKSKKYEKVDIYWQEF